MTDLPVSQRTKEWYERYYQKRGAERNDLLRNPEVLLQTLAYDASVISALRATRVDPHTTRILDVGCGAGGGMVNFLRLGFEPSNIFGIDVQEERIRLAQRKFPNVNFVCGNAAQMEQFEDEHFDVVFEATMFIQLTDDILAQQIADEMLRVCKPGGVVIIADWRYSKPGNSEYKAVSRKRIYRLFHVGSASIVVGIYPGALVPPVGRFLSRHNLAFVYFAVQFVFPFLVGQTTTVLQRIGPA